jgi:uncharacterized protein YgiM (DUF1202 family)
LASVEWVLSKFTPINERITVLETKVEQLSSGGNEGSDQPIRGTSDVITSSATSVKRGAAANYEDIVKVPRGTVLDFYDTYINSVSGEKWYLVKLANEKVGAVTANYSTVNINGDQSTYSKVVIVDNTPARRGASTNYSIYQTLTTNTVVSLVDDYVSSDGQKWYLIKLSDGRTAAIIATHAEVVK